MIPKHLFEIIRRIEITTSRMVTDVFAGEYHSVFKGRGMEFNEVREYSFGDDIRTIDWNVTARTGIAHVKKYVEERELTVMILVDLSRSCQFGSVRELKAKLAAEIAAVLAFCATRNNDKVGLILFTDRIEKFIPPRKGLIHVLRLIREALYFVPKGSATDLPVALDYLNRVTARKTVSFIVSDFLVNPAAGQTKPSTMAETWQKALRLANKRHDLVAVTLNDPREKGLPPCGLIELRDAETERMILVDSSDPGVRRRYEEEARRRIVQRETLFGIVGMDHIDVSTDLSYAKEMVKFFTRRKKRFR